MDDYNRTAVIQALTKVKPVDYEAFIETCNTLSNGMKGHHRRWVIESLTEVDSVNYKAFIETCNTLSNGMDELVIASLSKVAPVNYNSFIEACNRLSQGMSEYERQLVIESLAQLDPVNYNAFIDLLLVSVGYCNDPVSIIRFLDNLGPLYYTQLFGIDSNFMMMISNIFHVHPDCFQFIVDFIQQNPTFLPGVPPHEWQEIHDNLSRYSRFDIERIFTRLHQQYYHHAPVGTPQGLAFDIHNFANQQVMGENGASGSFNDLVLQELDKDMKKNGIAMLSYEKAVETMQAAFASLQKDHPDLKKALFNWAVSCVEGGDQDKLELSKAVSFLANNPNNLKLWLDCFLKESAEAYGNQGKSCVKGVKERAITSLRNVKIDNPEIQRLFSQAETPQILKAKKANLGNMDFWAKQLKDKGINQSSPFETAKSTYEKIVREYFADVITPTTTKEIDETIGEMLNLFDSDMWNVLLKPKLGDNPDHKLNMPVGGEKRHN